MSDYSPKRVVSLQPSVSVILESIGMLDRVVACTRYCVDVCPAINDGNPTIVADSWTARSEQIMAAHPDLVIAAVPYQNQAVVEILKSGARFLGLAPNTLQDIYTDVASISGIMGVPSRGDMVIARMRADIAAAKAKSGGSGRLRVYCEEWGKPLIHSQQWVAELVEALGGKFVGEPGKQTTAEAILEADPEVVIAAWCGAGDRVPLEKIIRDRRWENMNAVQTGRVFCVRDEYLNTPAPTLIRGLEALAAALFPNAFHYPLGLRQMKVTPRQVPT